MAEDSAEELVMEITNLILKHVKPLHDKIEALERKVAELQTKGVEYKGVYQRACSYERGALVTADGSMFVCVENVGPNTPPGQSQSWQLAVQKGRDARTERKPAA